MNVIIISTKLYLNLFVIIQLKKISFVQIMERHRTQATSKIFVSKMRRPWRLVANQQGSYDNCARCYFFLHIKRNIFWSMLYLPALWYFDTLVTYIQWFRRVKFVVIPPRFVKQQYLWNIAIQPAVSCYNSWANLRCSCCSPLGEISLWNWTII